MPVQAAAQLTARFVHAARVLILIGVLFHLVKLRKHGLGLGARVGDYTLRLAARFLIRFFKAHFKLRPEECRLFRALLGLTQLDRGPIPVLFKHEARLLKLFYGGFKAGGFRVHARFRVLYHVVAQAEAARYGKGVRFAGDADEQMIGRAQRLHVEFARRVLHARLVRGVHLKLRIVRGGCNDSALPARVFNYGDCKRRALSGVRARAKLVEQQQ